MKVLVILALIGLISSTQLQAGAYLSLQSGIEASANLKSQISLEQAEKMMANTVMMTKSQAHKDNSYLFGFELEPHDWIYIGIVIGLWVVGGIMAVICLIDSKNEHKKPEAQEENMEGGADENVALMQEDS